MRRSFVASSLAALALAGICLAQATDPAKESKDKKETKTLTIGDKAPAIDIAHWVKGEPVKKFESGKVYVVEFWATWCGPCRASMPHLTKLQEDYKDYNVTIIGISDEELDVVQGFLPKKDKDGKAWTDKIGYRLATDPDGSAKQDYMQAAGQRGIPTSFIVGKDAHIEWIGHPMNMDKALEAVVRDTWDRQAYKAKWERSQTASRQLDKFFTLLGKDNKPEEAYALGRELLENYDDNAQTLNAIAWFVLTNPTVEKRDLDFALKAANQANELTEGKDAAILDTLARAHYEKGDLKRAIEFQKKAVEQTGDSPLAEELTTVLKKYEDELAGKE